MKKQSIKKVTFEASIKLPETKGEWDSFKTKFYEVYGVEDSPETWTFVLSQLQAVKMPLIYFDPENVFLHYKRWKIAKVLQDEKMVYIQALQDKVEALMKAQGDINEGATSPSEHTEHVQSGPFIPEGPLQALPSPKEGMVQNSPERRF